MICQINFCCFWRGGFFEFLDFFYFESTYTLKKNVKLFLVFLTMLIILAARIYSQEQEYKEKIMQIKGRLKGNIHRV
jgi:hypothetical protein